jgi:dihydrofolate reductase
MNACKKFMLTTRESVEPLTWHNTEPVQVRDDVAFLRFIDRLKRQPGRNIHLAGGATLAQHAIRLGVVDEYRFNVHPVVSLGHSWFDAVQDQRALELVASETYTDGVVALTYRPRSS